MASLVSCDGKDKNGKPNGRTYCRVLVFVDDPSGARVRKTIRLGEMGKRQARRA